MTKDIMKDKKEKEESKTFDSEFDVLQRLLEVKTKGINKDLNEDYVLMHGSANKEEFITENLINAHFSRKLLEKYADYKKPKWNQKEFDWERDENNIIKKFPLSKEEIEIINDRAMKLFNFFMLKSHAIAELNRNKEGNFMLKLLGKYKEDEKEAVGYTIDDRNNLQRAVDGLKGKKDEEVEYD